MGSSFSIVELSEGRQSVMRKQNQTLARNFFLQLAHQVGNFQTEFPGSCRGRNWNFLAQLLSCRWDPRLSLCGPRGAPWLWLGLTGDGFLFRKLKSGSLNGTTQKRGRIFPHLAGVSLASTTLRRSPVYPERFSLRFACISNFQAEK